MGRAEALGTQLTTYAECLDPESVMEVEMVIEQAMMVVEAEEVDMRAGHRPVPRCLRDRRGSGRRRL